MVKTGQLDWDLIQLRAIKFVNRWKKSGKTNEKSYAHGFVIEFLNVFGIDWLTAPGEMEHKVFDGYSDYICFGKIIIEMKSKGADPGFQQAEGQLRRYTQNLADAQQPKLWMACDFENIRLWDRKADKVYDFATSKLVKYRKHFAEIAGLGAGIVHRDKEGVNREAAEKMAKLHDELKKHAYSGQDLEIYLARLLFCLFANDTDIFEQDSFQKYIEGSDESGSDLDAHLSQLFQDLNEPVEDRVSHTYFKGQIDSTHFKYINGGLFERPIRHAKFDKKMRQALLECLEFDWSQISPAIFGSMFQGVMDRDQRRVIGAHYTSEENILKLINPLFMDNLRSEFEAIKKKSKLKDKNLVAFQQKLSKLKCLDPACGCGNFLIIAYRELRRLELEVLKAMLGDKQTNYMATPVAGNVLVNVNQFYGIEIEEWPCQIARTGMWLMDHLMNLEATAVFEKYEYRLPLKESATILHGNAHRIEWESLVPKNDLSYIMGNPPFVGARGHGQEGEEKKRKKEDMQFVFGNMKGIGNLDYVTAWYKKAADYMEGNKNLCTAFVSTNSITQGEQVTLLWKPLMEQGIFINFGIPTFKWSNEAKGIAAVHCVIVGFSYNKTEPTINPYLAEAPTVFVEGRTSPICDAPPINYGSFALDDGNYTISEDEYNQIVSAEPNAKRFLRPFLGARELIHNEKRYCLWLLGADPSEISESKTIMQKVDNVRKWRAKSNRRNTVLLTDTPTLFAEIRQPETSYLAIPTVSSESRKYIPIAYLEPETIASNQLYVVPNATLYHFGILTSSVHMAWVRAVCGRLESRYRYSSAVVYNNFPWPEATAKQIANTEELAQSILDARAYFPKSSLAILYNIRTMPPELQKAHHALDKAVMKLYGFGKDITESEIVWELMERFQAL